METVSIIAGPNQHSIAVVVPAHPVPCDYFRLVIFDRARSRIKELLYWNSYEWQKEDDDLSCIGAIAAVIKQVNDGHNFIEEQGARRGFEWETITL